MTLSPSRQWYVMRDLKRRNANRLAYQDLTEAGLEVFTPIKQMVMTIGGKKQRRDVPVIQDLLFVNASKKELDPQVEKYPNLQYRFVRGQSLNRPMTVRDDEMRRFIYAVNATDSPRFYSSGELTEEMIGKEVRIIGGPLDGFEGKLLSVRGMRKRRLIVEIPGMIAAAVEVDPRYIEFI